jgi:hypothetical protein
MPPHSTASRNSNAPTSSAYRGRVPAATRARLSLDLAKPPPGFTGREKQATLLKAWTETKLIAQDEPGENEYRITWLACATSATFIRSGEPIRARATLETALAITREPSYRALLLARLARCAASAKAPALARVWLGLVEPQLRAPEVTTEIRVAKAFVAREEPGGPEAVLEALGSEGKPLAGHARHLATALRTDALEQLGRVHEADATWRAGTQAGALAIGSYAGLYGLAPKTQSRSVRRLIAVLSLILLLLVLLFLLVSWGVRTLF